MKAIIGVAGAALLLAGCASNNMLYEWGSYQPALINYTKNGDKAKFEEELRESIAIAEAKNKVPPGIYAELGYLLYSQDKIADATIYFVKERDHFPESATLMNKMIAGAQTEQDAGATQ